MVSKHFSLCSLNLCWPALGFLAAFETGRPFAAKERRGGGHVTEGLRKSLTAFTVATPLGALATGAPCKKLSRWPEASNIIFVELVPEFLFLFLSRRTWSLHDPT